MAKSPTAPVILEVEHVTTYRYARPVRFGPHKLMFRPRPGHDLRVLDAAVEVSPGADLAWMQDVFDNAVAHVAPRGARCIAEIGPDLALRESR
ncbi:MAG: hypothetical protein EXR27_03275 [Betaproteobacteria bacterium]|nr:hypothetical protein [Betaproteobacteria bacterium]